MSIKKIWNMLPSSILLVLTATVLMLSGVIIPHEATASVDALNQWPATPMIVSNSATPGVLTAKFTPVAAPNRLMLVAVATEYTGAVTAPTFTVTYGGQSVFLLQQVNAAANNSKIWLGVLLESGVAAGSAGTKILSVTNSNTTNLVATYVSAAVYGSVDQINPVANPGYTGSGSLGTTANATTIGPVAVALTNHAGLAGNNGISVYLTNWNNNVGQTTASGGYTLVRNYVGTNFSLSASYKATAGTTAESITSTSTTTAVGALAAINLNPALRVAASGSCADCHGYPPQDGSATRGVPSGQFSGNHEKHSGGDEAEYSYACTTCHYNAVGYNHSTGFKNITGSRLPGNAYVPGRKIATTNTPTLGNCNNTLCHSSGRRLGTNQYNTTTNWGSATLTCLACHGGRNGANYARSTAGFALSTTHQQHLGKYPIANINCNECHSKTTTDAATLKAYSGVQHHVNGTPDVDFGSNATYGTYTSYKTSGINNGKCLNTSCHGGKTRGAWSATVINTENTCVHCHGTAGTSAALPNTAANRKFFAPGYNRTGTSTDQTNSSNDKRVGSHFKHLSSAYMKNIKCNECHTVPLNVFDGTHLGAQSRYNSQTLTFAQASSARWDGVALAQVSAFAGYTNGTATKAATCSSVYCHGARLKNGDTAGTYRKPYWNYSAMINYTDKATACARCHGNPPTANAHSALTTCSGCHSNIGANNTSILNKNLHINGIVEASGGHAVPYYATTAGHTGCLSGIGCHANVNPVPAYTGTGTPDCRACHLKADPTVATNGCGSCHGAANGTGEPNGTIHPDAAGAHAKHTVSTLATCVYCHNIGGTGGNADHGPGNKGTNPAVVSVNQGWNGTTTCNTSYCHSTVQIASGGAGAPTYKTTTNWAGGAAMTCTSCHGNDAATLATGSHVKHLTATTHAAITCANCHSGFETGTGAAHANNVINIQQSAILSSTGTYTDSAGAPGNGFGSCGTAYCHSNVQSATGGARVAGDYKTVTWGSAAMNCASCHGNTAATLVTGTHAKHLNATYGYTCAACHGTTGGAGNTTIHANQTINIDLTTKGASATYSGDGIPGNSNFGSCNNTICHGKNSGAWGANVSTQLCTECHGQPNVAYPNFSSSIIAPGGSGVDTGGNTAANSTRVGAHQNHLLAATGISDKIHCGECHTTHITIQDASHLNYTTSTITFGPLAKSLAHAPTVTRVSGIINCSTTECHHGGSRVDGTAAGQSGITPRAALAWNNTALLGGTTIADTCTGKCHNMPPGGAVPSDTHATLTASGTYTTPAQLATACSSCHNELSSSATTLANLWANKNLHINGTVDASASCVDCHAVAKGTRSAVVGEFGRAWGHKKSGRGAVTDADCIVCHLEGDSSTGKINPTYHLGLPNGNIDLRDPDGTGEAPIAGLTFTKFAISYASGSRTTAIGTTVDFKITQLFCLKCHDAGGATNTTARAGSSPTANAPFGGGFTATNSAAQFATTNSSKHPILGPLTRDYPAATRMAIPYKPTGTRGTSGTKTAGVVMNCFDCHNDPTTPLTTRTIVSHGNANTIRGTIGVATPTLCEICHLGYTASGTVGHNSGSLTSGSAFSSAENRMQTEQDTCNYCHADVLSPAGPARATNVHGTNVLPAGTKTGRWALGTAQSVPVAFIRNTGYLSNHQPKNVAGTAYSPQCSMVNCASRAGSPYSLGGTY